MHIQSSYVGAEDIAETLANIRLPPFLAHVQTLVVLFTDKASTFSHFTAVAVTDQSTSSSSSAQHADDGDENGADVRRSKRQRVMSIGLDSLTQLRTLVFERVHCRGCQHNSDIRSVYRQRSSVPFPYLPNLTALVAQGQIDSHCMSLLPTLVYGQEYKEKQPSTAKLPYLPQLRVLVRSGEFSKHFATALQEAEVVSGEMMAVGWWCDGDDESGQRVVCYPCLLCCVVCDGDGGACCSIYCIVHRNGALCALHHSHNYNTPRMCDFPTEQMSR